MYKLTTERIRQIQKRAIKRLRHHSRSHALRVYL
ncbi:MAG TPA: sigma factor-like helix-turn-helix DNA-binding protein [Spirochaetia bacterium]|nr:sigma factor-like helix-turn-helix DNA-binding protein [Spirochaetia bacterium]